MMQMENRVSEDQIEVKPLMEKIAYLDCLVRKLQGQVRGRGQTICLLQGKLYQWDQAVIEGAKLAGYSLKWDDPDYDPTIGWPPGVYPGHIEKLIQHIVDRKNGVITEFMAEFMAERLRLVGRMEVQENEIKELHQHIIELSRRLLRSEDPTQPVCPTKSSAEKESLFPYHLRPLRPPCGEQGSPSPLGEGLQDPYQEGGEMKRAVQVKRVKRLQDLKTSIEELAKPDEAVPCSRRTQHSLKVWPPYYQDILDYKKRFELRKKRDRNFQVGDTLRLAEFVPCKAFPDQISQKGEFTGRECLVEVLYVLGGVFLPEGYACMSISKPVVLHL